MIRLDEGKDTFLSTSLWISRLLVVGGTGVFLIVACLFGPRAGVAIRGWEFDNLPWEMYAAYWLTQWHFVWWGPLCVYVYLRRRFKQEPAFEVLVNMVIALALGACLLLIGSTSCGFIGRLGVI